MVRFCPQPGFSDYCPSAGAAQIRNILGILLQWESKPQSGHRF